MLRPAAPLLLIGLLVAPVAPTSAEDLAEHWPRRVLITNDNGMDDPKIVALARAFAPVAETWVVAPLEDRSGSTHYLSVTRAGECAPSHASWERESGPGPWTAIRPTPCCSPCLA